MSVLPLLSLIAALHAPADTTLAFGAKLPAGKALPLATVAAAPAQYAGKTVVVEGTITAVCQEQGCWMQIAHDTTKGALPARVDFAHKFFIPMNSAGMKAKIVGVASVKTYTKDEADHLVGEGGTLTRKADGTATGIEFVATGVELTGTLGTPPIKKAAPHDMGSMKMGGGR